MGFRLGVDLGTTWTAAAVDEGGRTEPLTLGTHGWAIPSVVSVEGDQVVAGEAAVRRAASEPASAAREFKRRLGDPAPFVLGGSPYGAEALTGHLLAHVVAVATERLGRPPDTVALAHPAAWGEFKLDQLREAARLARVDPVELVPEPAAAAVEYVRAGKADAGSVVAVYDFGGGTFDAAVVRAEPERAELLGPAEGLERLGGVDLDTAVLAHVHGALGGALDDIDRRDPEVRRALARLRDECVVAKEALSSDTDASIPVDLPGLRTEVRLTRAELEAMIRPRLDDTVAALRRALDGAGLEPDAVSAIVLVGGMSRMPLVGQVLTETFNRPVLADIDPKLAVARGAATHGTPLPASDTPATAADGTAAGGGAAAVGVASVQGAADGAPGSKAPPPSRGVAGRRVAAGAAVAGAAVAGTATAASAWSLGDDGDDRQQGVATPPEDLAPPPPPPVPPPPADESLDIMDEVAPPPAPRAAAGAAPAMDRPSPRHEPRAAPRPPAPSEAASATRPPDPPPPEQAGTGSTRSRTAPPTTTPEAGESRPDAGQSTQGAGQPQTGRETGPPPATEARPAPPSATAEEQLAAFKQERLDNLARWKPPEGTDPKDVAEFRREAAELIGRFQLKPGESAEEAIPVLQNQLGDRLSLFRREQQAEAASRRLEAQEADFKDDKAEYDATRDALKEAVSGFKPTFDGYTDKDELRDVKKLLVQRIEGKQFNDNQPVAKQQELLAQEVASALRQWEVAEYMGTLRPWQDKLAFQQDRLRNGSPAEKATATNEIPYLKAELESRQVVLPRLKELSTDAGLYGKVTAAKIEATLSTDPDDTGLRPPPVTTPASAPDPGKAAIDPRAATTGPTDSPPGDPTKKAVADPAPDDVPARAAMATKPTALPDAFDNDTAATPAAATMGSQGTRAAAFSTAPAAAAAAAAALDDDPVTPGADGPASGPLGWDGKPLPPEMADMKTFAAAAAAPAEASDDDVLGIGAAWASVPNAGAVPPRSSTEAPDEPAAAALVSGNGDGWKFPEDDHLGTAPPAADLGPEPTMPGGDLDDASADSGGLDADRDDVLGL